MHLKFQLKADNAYTSWRLHYTSSTSHNVADVEDNTAARSNAHLIIQYPFNNSRAWQKSAPFITMELQITAFIEEEMPVQPVAPLPISIKICDSSYWSHYSMQCLQ